MYIGQNYSKAMKLGLSFYLEYAPPPLIVNGNWESLLMAAQRCVFGIVEHPEGVVITVHYAPCLEKKVYIL